MTTLKQALKNNKLKDFIKEHEQDNQKDYWYFDVQNIGFTVYQNSYNNVNAYIQIISPNAIIADANARNKTFLDIIKKNTLSMMF